MYKLKIMSWVYSNPLKASIFHLNRNADFRHEFPGVVGDAVVNQGDFPGKSSDCHVMLRNVRQKFAVLGSGFHMTAPEADADADSGWY